MKIPNLHKFGNDIRDLYVETKNSDVEDLFIRIAQSYNQNLQKWLSYGHTIQTVKPLLSDPEVYDALLVLNQIRSKHPVSVSVPDIISFFDKSKSSSLFPIVVSFSGIQNDQAESVLAPFKDIVNTCSVFEADIEISLESITQDLVTVHNSFMDYVAGKNNGEKEFKKQKKPTKREQKMSMFAGMLRRFSGEIESAARRIGQNDFADALGKGILANLNSMKQHAPVGDIDTYMWNEAARISKSVLQNLGDLNVDSNYNFAKERCMHFMSMISTADLLAFYKGRSGDVDMSSFMDEETMPDESVLGKELQSLSITDAQLLNPDYLAMVSAFFMSFYSKLK